MSESGPIHPAIPYSLFPIPYSLFPIPYSLAPPTNRRRRGTNPHRRRTSSAYRVWYFSPRNSMVPISGMLIISVCFSLNPHERLRPVGRLNRASLSA